jgi:hypothetical protein
MTPVSHTTREARGPDLQRVLNSLFFPLFHRVVMKPQRPRRIRAIEIRWGIYRPVTVPKCK